MKTIKTYNYIKPLNEQIINLAKVRIKKTPRVVAFLSVITHPTVAVRLLTNMFITYKKKH